MGKESIKVLHVDTVKSWRGGQQQVVYLLQAMHKAGFQTALVCQPDSKLHDFCAEETIPHFSMKMAGEIDFIAGWKISKIVRKYRFQILHLHSAHALAIGLWVKFFAPELKLIAVRRVDFHIKKNFLSQFKYKTKLLDQIICISDGIKRVLIQDGVPPNKLMTIHSGIDVHRFKHTILPQNFRVRLGIPEAHIIIGTIAAMAGHKDYPNLLKAARIVFDNTENVTFCAVGDGPLREEVQTLAENLNLGKRFVFTGYREDIEHFLKIFDIFILASKKEGLGTSLLDAQAAGLPIIACNTGGIPEVVTHNQTGLLVPPKNEQALADAIMTLIRNEQLRRTFTENANKSVLKFDIKNTIEHNIELYKKLLTSQEKFINERKY